MPWWTWVLVGILAGLVLFIRYLDALPADPEPDEGPHDTADTDHREALDKARGQK